MPKSRLSERECDRRAMLFWNGAGKPEGQYPTYRKAVDQWNNDGAVEGKFDSCLKAIRAEERDLKKQQAEEKAAQRKLTTYQIEETEEQRNLKAVQALTATQWRRIIPKSWFWPWLTVFFIPLLTAGVIYNQIQASKESVERTIEVQREQNRQQVLKDYISQMTVLVVDKDLNNKYPKNEQGEYVPEAKASPESISASSLTKTVLKVLEKDSSQDDPFNLERGSLLVFLYESNLIQVDKPVIDLGRATFTGASLRNAILSGTNLSGVILNGADLFGSKLSVSHLIEANFIEANLGVVDFRGAKLLGASFINANLVDATLEGANLERVDFTRADLEGAILRSANLSGADFSGANLSGAKLDNATVIGKDEVGNERKADFRDAKGLTDEQKAYLKSRGALVDD